MVRNAILSPNQIVERDAGFWWDINAIDVLVQGYTCQSVAGTQLEEGRRRSCDKTRRGAATTLDAVVPRRGDEDAADARW